MRCRTQSIYPALAGVLFVACNGPAPTETPSQDDMSMRQEDLPQDMRPIPCSSPLRCPSSAPVCCGKYQGPLDIGVGMMTPASVREPICQTTCSTDRDLRRLCEASADCRGDSAGNVTCCSFPEDILSAPGRVCVDARFASLATLAGGRCFP